MALATDRDTREFQKFSEDGGVKTSAVKEVLSITPTINTVQYTAGDAVGGKQTLAAGLAAGLPVQLDSIVVQDVSNQKAALTVLFFDADPAAATITNNNAFAFVTDMAKCIGRSNIAAADYETIDSQAVATIRNLGMILKPVASTLYAVVMLTSGTPTYAVGALTFKYGFKQS